MEQVLATHYVGSKGPVPIASMPFPHLQNAHRKLVASGDPARSPEVAAMAARLAELEAEGGEQEAAPPPTAEPNPRIHLGANNPPEATPFEAHRLNMEDLLEEARGWADGATVETQGQADDISRLIDDLRKAGDAADAERLREKRPLDEQIEEIQARYNLWIGGLKSKVKNPGKVVMAMDALKACLKPYLDRLDDERKERERLAREGADRLAREARDAFQAAQASDLASREAAETLVAQARAAATEAKHIAAERPHAVGGERAMGLRRYWIATLTDRKAALLHYLAADPDAIVACLQGLADQDVRSGKRALPGFVVTEETRL